MTPRTIKAVLFDLGETLINYEAADPVEQFAKGARLAHDYLTQIGHQLPPLKAYTRKQLRAVKRHYAWAWLTNRDFNAIDLLAATHRRFGVELDQPTRQKLADLYYQPLAQHATLEPGAIDMLTRLRNTGLALAIVSNTFIPGHTLDAHLTREGLIDFFPVRLYSCDVIYRKPHRRIFKLTAQQLNVEPQHCIFVGDRLDADVKGANRVGMVSVLKRDAPATGRIQPHHHVRRLADELPAIIESYNP